MKAPVQEDRREQILYQYQSVIYVQGECSYRRAEEEGEVQRQVDWSLSRPPLPCAKLKRSTHSVPPPPAGACPAPALALGMALVW